MPVSCAIHPAESRQWLAYAPLAALPTAAQVGLLLLPGWEFMWAMAGALFFSGKWLTYWHASPSMPDFRGLLYLFNLRTVEIRWVETFQHQITVAGNHCEQIVEVVRQSPSEATNCFHLPGLLEKFCGFRRRILCHPVFWP